MNDSGFFPESFPCGTVEAETQSEKVIKASTILET